MQRKHIRLVGYILCMGVAAALLLMQVVQSLPPSPPRYSSTHPACSVPPLMGFSDDSVFNTGDAGALEQFPGVGEVISRRIIETRELLGGYRLPEDLMLVKGVGEKTLDKMLAALDEALVLLPELDEKVRQF